MEITIKLATEEDSEFVYELMQDKDCKKYILDRLRAKTIEDQKRKIRSYAAQTKKQNRYYLIALLGKEKIGIIDIYNISKEDERGAVGYAISKKYRGKGFATKIIKKAILFVKRKIKIHAIEATVDPKNIASKKTLEKIGFKSVGIMKKYSKVNNKYTDREIYWKLLR
jgi:ribosomal-protein-alanine N-acetyltransferase